MAPPGRRCRKQGAGRPDGQTRQSRRRHDSPSPKADEDPAQAARRETEEELGVAIADTPWPLATIGQAGGKVVAAFALEQVVDTDVITTNMFEMEWPHRSGKRASFPEVDQAAWYGWDRAAAMMLVSQRPLLDALKAVVGD